MGRGTGRAVTRGPAFCDSSALVPTVIQPSDASCTEAAQLVNRYDLRAADALQLAAALVWCQHVPTGRVLLTADEKLRDAALLCGFDANQL